MDNIKLILQYDGGAYVGWQRQPRRCGMSVQQRVEDALSELYGETIAVNGAGRTDSGVHAYAQVANYLSARPLPVQRIAPALNRLLPADIRAVSAELMAEDFHPRFSAHRKTYRYLLERGRRVSAFGTGYSWQVAQELDVAAMRRAAELLRGEHDFRHFTLTKASVSNYVRNISAISIYEPPAEQGFFPWQQLCRPLAVEVTANGFLYKMMRIISARLTAVGSGELSEQQFAGFLTGEYWRNIPPAPPQGLMLMNVEYFSAKNAG
ncbi:MAG: tRNA pseudouridine(38-40) synthase TruA [Bacillota bacterium]|nr:tRNA pseudouridine(38-40) synthase TruA [Bacillota bacterium]